MKSLSKIMFWLVGGVAACLTVLLILSGKETRWPFKNGYVKVLPVSKWPNHGGSTRFIRQRDGTYQAQICETHVIFCTFQTIRNAEAVNLLAQAEGIDLNR